jgi:hypothetical protein
VTLKYLNQAASDLFGSAYSALKYTDRSLNFYFRLSENDVFHYDRETADAVIEQAELELKDSLNSRK